MMRERAPLQLSFVGIEVRVHCMLLELRPTGTRPLCFTGAGADVAPENFWCLMEALAL